MSASAPQELVPGGQPELDETVISSEVRVDVVRSLGELWACRDNRIAVRFAYGNHPGRSTASLALWLIVVSTFAAVPITRGKLLNTPAETQVSERIDAEPTTP